MTTFSLHSVLWQRLVQGSEAWEGWANLQWLHALLLHIKHMEGSSWRFSSCCRPKPAFKMQISSKCLMLRWNQAWWPDLTHVVGYLNRVLVHFQFLENGGDGQSAVSGNLLFHASRRNWEVWFCRSSTYWGSSCLAIQGWRGKAEEGQEREGPQTLSHNSTLEMTTSLLGHSCKCCTNLLRKAKPTGPNLATFH